MGSGVIQGPPGPPIEKLIRHLYLDDGKEYSRNQVERIMGFDDATPQGMETLQFHAGSYPVCVHGEGKYIRLLFTYVASHDDAVFIAHYKQGYLYRYYDAQLGGTIAYLREQQKIRFFPRGYPAAVRYFYTYDWRFPPKWGEEQS